MTHSKPLQSYLPPAILAVSLLFIYAKTLAPGLSWANGGSDGGDLITAAATGGVAHPTGYPLYLLLARLFQSLPLGSLAYRTNLFSAVAMALASVLVYILVTGAARGSSRSSWPAGMAAGFAFGLAPLVWSQAVITEVYGLQALLVALLLCLYTVAVPGSNAARERLDRLRGLVLGLAMGNHMTTFLLAPLLFVSGSIDRHSDGSRDTGTSRWGSFRLDRGALLRQLGMFAAALSIYVILPLRALASPPVNWGNAVTLQRFWWLVSGGLYQGDNLGSSLAEIGERIPVMAALLLQQFGYAGIVLALFGLLVFGVPSRLYILSGWTAVAHVLFALFYRSVDSYVYLIPALLSFAVWVGLGINGLADRLPGRHSFLRSSLGLLIVVYFAGRSITFLSQVDASKDLRAESFGREVMTSAPKNAMVYARGDHAVFALWYFHFALGERPDLAIVAADLLHFDWYAESLRSQYPALEITAPFPWPETMIADNPALPFCYVEYADESMLDCTDPGNTD